MWEYVKVYKFTYQGDIEMVEEGLLLGNDL
jgi:hypothetical protein